jgi:hypothetical protein
MVVVAAATRPISTVVAEQTMWLAPWVSPSQNR